MKAWQGTELCDHCLDKYGVVSQLREITVRRRVGTDLWTWNAPMRDVRILKCPTCGMEKQVV